MTQGIGMVDINLCCWYIACSAAVEKGMGKLGSKEEFGSGSEGVVGPPFE